MSRLDLVCHVTSRLDLDKARQGKARHGTARLGGGGSTRAFGTLFPFSTSP